jgi:tetratricopeptide (TPR) repeat protein
VNSTALAFLLALQVGPAGTPTPNQAPVVQPERPARATPAPARPRTGAAAPADRALPPRYRSCIEQVRAEPEAAARAANAWLIDGGGLLARQCLGLAYVALERWAPAATVYEQAAAAAATANDLGRGDFLVQAGNAWLAAGEPTRAVLAFDGALAASGLSDGLRGEVHLDRARAMVAMNNLAAARQDIDRAAALVPGDAMVWYLSAELARRESDLARAQTDIQRAMSLAADSPDIILLAGTIAGQRGDMERAEALYRRVAQLAPNSDAGRAAAASLATIQRPATPAPQPAPAQPPRPGGQSR